MSQTTISSFFKPSSQEYCKVLGSPIQMDLTATSDDFVQPPPKKIRLDSDIFQCPRTESSGTKQRRDALRKKLLLENNPFLKEKDDKPQKAIEVDFTEFSGVETDKAFQELTAVFSGCKKRKGKEKPVFSKKSQEQVALGPSGQSYTPLEKQILQLQKENQGTVLMVEVGYKFKFFGDDAKVASKELGMVAFNDRNFLVASIPVHRCSVHLKKLLSQGYRVGIARQVETAALKKASDNRSALFERKLTHLYTAATYVDDLESVDDLERHLPPQFMCLIEDSKSKHSDLSMGIIIICPSTGEVIWDDFDDSIMHFELETRLVHLRPTEVLLSREVSDATWKLIDHYAVSSFSGKIRTELFDDQMTYSESFTLVSHFYSEKTKSGIASESFKSGKLVAEMIDFPKRVVIALAHAIKYLSAFGIVDVLLETKFFNKFTSRVHMLLNTNTLANLEIYRNETDYTVHGSLLWILDKTSTKFGARLLRTWIGQPLANKRILEDRFNALEEILCSSSDKLVTLRHLLKNLPDLAKGLCKIQYGQLTTEELAVLLSAFQKVANSYSSFETPGDVGFKSSLLNDIIYSLPSLMQPLEVLMGSIYLKHAAEGRKDRMWTNPERYPGIVDADLAMKFIEAELSDELISIRKILRLPSITWTANSGDEYLIEIKRSDNNRIPDNWILHSRTKHYSRYQPPTVKSKVDEMLQQQETLQAEANKAFSSFLKEIAVNHYGLFRNAVNKLATADCLLSLALVALQENYVRPQFTDDDVLEIVNGRHPMVEMLRTDPFISNSIKLGGSRPKSAIITGPNMGGKSSCVRMIALIAIMAQIGSYVPAESVTIRLLDSVFTRMGASDDLARGRSTFMMEMSETSEILHTASLNTLVILDELGRGTSTFDGMAIADAVMHQLVQKIECKTLFITHFPLVASNMGNQCPLKVQNLHMGYEAESRIDGTREIAFLYKLSQGIATESFGIECGRLAGLPESLLTMASQNSLNLRSRISERTTRNKLFRSVYLVGQCLNQENQEKTIHMAELLNIANWMASR